VSLYGLPHAALHVFLLGPVDDGELLQLREDLRSLLATDAVDRAAVT
jgi:hypothetical protein